MGFLWKDQRIRAYASKTFRSWSSDGIFSHTNLQGFNCFSQSSEVIVSRALAPTLVRFHVSGICEQLQECGHLQHG